MGQKNSNNSNNNKESLENSTPKKKENNINNKINLNLQKNSFDFLYVIGKGGFGKVNILILK